MFQPIKNKYISTPLIKLVCRCSSCKDDKYIYEMKNLIEFSMLICRLARTKTGSFVESPRH